MKTKRGWGWASAIMAGCGLLTTHAWAQGDLTPPGAPAPTMKTLTQVEPRTPIASAPFTISQPGSYYLTTNLASTGHGIIIQSDCVTLDLMGFSLTGNRSGSSYGILLNGATNALLRDIVVRNGAVIRFGSGVSCKYAQNCRIESLLVSSNLSDGVTLYGYSGHCDGNTLDNCAINGNGTYGVNLNGSSGYCDGNTLANCAISGNGNYGVNLYGSSGQCNGNTIANCAITGNHYGVNLDGSSGQCNGNTLANCAISGNGYGVNLDGYSGQCNGNTVRDCVLRANADKGIYANYADGNRIENNHVSGTTGGGYGISTAFSSANLILKNSCVGQTYNYTISTNDTYGPIVTNVGALATTNGAAALSPWANFSR